MLFESEQNQKRVIQEVVYDVAPKHNLKKQVELHEKIITNNILTGYCTESGAGRCGYETQTDRLLCRCALRCLRDHCA